LNDATNHGLRQHPPLQQQHGYWSTAGGGGMPLAFNLDEGD